MTLISTIGDSLGTITWSSMTADVPMNYYYGLLLNGMTVSNVQTKLDAQIALDTLAGQEYAMELLHFTWQFALPSTKLIDSAKTLLNQVDMLGTTHCPWTTTYSAHDYTHMHHRNYWFAYGLSRAINYLQSKWDSSLAWQELKGVFDAAGGIGVLMADPRDNTYYADAYSRTYDEHLESADWLLRLYEVDKKNNASALTYARDTLWTWINANRWSTNHWKYGTDTGYECAGCWIAQIALRLYRLNGGSLTNWDRVTTDIYTRYLANGWDSPNWTYETTKYYVTVHHHDITSQRRLGDTLGAWLTLHMFYQLLNSASQTAIQTLLDGTTKAWEYLTSTTPGLYDSATKRFRPFSDDTLQDYATAEGIALMFLLGIVPQTGSLYIPVDEWCYEDTAGACGLLRTFNFDYTNKKIKIPVKAGSIKFIYGTTPVTQTFSSDGVYEVRFSSDWNKISRVIKLRSLDTDLMYVVDPTPSDTDWSMSRNVASAVRGHGESVTRRKLILQHFRDPTIGWYAKDYEESTINMLIAPKNAQREALAMGFYVTLDALGFTTSTIALGDQIKTGNEQYYEVETVIKCYYQGKFVQYACDLKELPLYEEED